MPRISADVTASTFVRRHRTSCQPAQVVKLSRHGGLRANLATAKTAASCPFRIFGIWHMTIEVTVGTKIGTSAMCSIARSSVRMADEVKSPEFLDSLVAQSNTWLLCLLLPS